jgi:hypothetical protein
MLITQSQIADRFKRSLSNVRKHAMRGEFPPPIKTGVGPTGRTNLYDLEDITFYWQTFKDGRTKEAKARQRRRR